MNLHRVWNKYSFQAVIFHDQIIRKKQPDIACFGIHGACRNSWGLPQQQSLTGRINGMVLLPEREKLFHKKRRIHHASQSC